MTLHEACSAIENNPALDELKNILISEIQTDFYCHSCHKTSDYLKSSSTQIFIFKLTPKNELVAHPVVSKDSEDSANDEQLCTHCKFSTKHITLPIHKQVFYKCPLVLMVSFTVIIITTFRLQNNLRSM
jgi:hypothetical protein